jgi:hypothetical protein
VNIKTIQDADHEPALGIIEEVTIMKKKLLFSSLALLMICCLTNLQNVFAQSEGSLANDEWGTVYFGDLERCYAIKYVYTQPSHSKGEMSKIFIWINKRQVATLLQDQSTDVCGKKIEVSGWCGGSACRMYWIAAPISSY